MRTVSEILNVSRSGFGTIKTELETADYENSFQARRELFEYICYYNQD